jgi:hypothetical protein
MVDDYLRLSMGIIMDDKYMDLVIFSSDLVIVEQLHRHDKNLSFLEGLFGKILCLRLLNE